MEEEPKLSPLPLTTVAILPKRDNTSPPSSQSPLSTTTPNIRNPWRVAHRLVTPHPLQVQGSIETVWEFRDGEQRIAVYSGPDAPQQRTLHISFQLPPDALAPDNSGSCCLQWTVFENRKTKKDGANPAIINSTANLASVPILACLIHPNAVTLWDVYGKEESSIYPSEGWTVTLPFDCRGIFALPAESGGGLILQRMESPDDQELFSTVVAEETTGGSESQQQQQQQQQQHQYPPNTTRRTRQDHNEHDNFLQGPPSAPAWKSNSNKNNNVSILPACPLPSDPAEVVSPTSSGGAAVASLFSLHHPLEDVLPVMLMTSSQANVDRKKKNSFAPQPPPPSMFGARQLQPVTDALEQVLWVGWAEFGNDPAVNSTTTTATLMVTYHSQQRCHTIWSLREAPPPPPEIPLHKQIRQKYCLGSSSNNNNNGNPAEALLATSTWGDPDDVSMVVMESRTTNTGSRRSGFLTAPPPALRVSRDEALADALGVSSLSVATATRKTSLAGAAAAGAGGGNNNTSSNNATSHRKRTSESFLFSPNNLDISHNVTSASLLAPQVSPSIQHPLYAKHAVQCLYVFEDDDDDHENTADPVAASNIFLASNIECTGTAVLALQRRQHLFLFVLASSPTPPPTTTMTATMSAAADHSSTVTVRLLDVIACRSACPIQACPSPARHCANQKEAQQHSKTRVTDIMVLRLSGSLALYRAYWLVTECCLSSCGDNPVLLGLEDAVRDRVSVVVGAASDAEKAMIGMIRCQLKLTFGDCPAADRVLAAVDAALFQASYPQPALQIRVDCCRLVSALQDDVGASGMMLMMVDKPLVFTVFQEIFLALLLHETGASTTWVAAAEVADETMHRDDSDWDILLRSDYHKMHGMDFAGLLKGHNDTVDDPDGPTDPSLSIVRDRLEEIGSLLLVGQRKSVSAGGLLNLILDCLHLLIEDSMLASGTARMETSQTVSMLLGLYQTIKIVSPATAPVADKFLEYYRSETSSQLFHQATSRATLRRLQPVTDPCMEWRMTTFDSPPSIIEWIAKRLKGTATRAEDFYERCDRQAINAVCTLTHSVLKIFSVLTRSGGSQPERDVDLVQTLPDEGFSDPSMIREELLPGVALPILESLYRLRNHPDSVSLPSLSPEAWTLVGRKDIALNMSDDSVQPPIPANTPDLEDETKDGLVPLERSSAMLFPEDNRVHEAARLLCSSRPIFLRVPRAVEVSDHDYERLKQKQLSRLANRSLALPVGRGMVTIGSLRPVPAEPLPVPDICLKGKVPPTNATLNLDISDSPTDMKVWPDFHNGVAAGLRLPLNGEQADWRSTVTRPWVIHNRPTASRAPPARESNDDTPAPAPKNYAHGGLLFALGLRGHLTVLEMSDFYEYLTQGTVTTTVGVLLGLAANKRGSCDMSVSKMICLHIPSLIPQHFSAIDVASTVQASAVTASGLLYQGSCSRMMTEFLLNAIGKRPESDGNTANREAYTLACGLALGTVNLAKSSKGVDEQDGLADLHIEERLLRYIIGGVDLDEARRTRESNDRFSIPSAANGSDSEKCSTIYEGPMINTDVTAPAATLALGLMYIKSDNNTIASALSLPDTHFLLDFVRPDFLGLRVISRAMIMWSEVQPTDEWIESQLPAVVQKAYAHIRAAAKAAYGLHSPKGSSMQVADFDRRAVRQMYVHIVSGACFGMGLRYAGTGNPEAKSALMKRVSELHALRDANDPVSAASRPEIPILETCLGTAAISLALVMAGTGDLDSLRLFKILRWRCDEDSRYGIHMIYGMAVGLLFLGGGTCTVGREPEDIAALVSAFFPRFPLSSTDNQYHLQALRHLYALAVQRKELRAIDVDTGVDEYVQIRVTTEGAAEPQQFKVPFLLRNSDKPLIELEVISEQYYPLRLDLSKHRESYVFYVKKRTPTITSNFRFPSFPRQVVGHEAVIARKNATGKIKSSTENVFLISFADYICDSSTQSRGEPAMTDFLNRVLLECLTNDSDEALPLYLAIHHGIGSSGNEGRSATFSRNLQLIRIFCQERPRMTGGCNQSTLPLLNTQLLLPYLEELTDSAALHKLLF